MDTKKSAVQPREAVRCAIYARSASSPQQAGESAATQQIARCKVTAHKAGWTVVEDCVRADEGKSGITMDGRRGLRELLALAATRPRPFDTLICESTDRLARNISIASQIFDAFKIDGVTIHFAAQNSGTTDPHFLELFNPHGQVDSAYLSSRGASIGRGVQRSKLKKAKTAALDLDRPPACSHACADCLGCRQ